MPARAGFYGRRGRRITVLPQGAPEFFRRRAAECLGAVLVLLGAACALALLSYSSTDPSLNRVTSGAVVNWLGRPGAYVADLLLQTLGLVAAAPPLVLVAWGLRFFSADAPRRMWLMVSLMPVAALLLALAVAALPATPPAILRPGLGGFAGKMMFELAVRATGFAAPTLAMVAGGLGAAIFSYVAGLSARRWRQGAALALRGARNGAIVFAGWVYYASQWLAHELPRAMNAVRRLAARIEPPRPRLRRREPLMEGVAAVDEPLPEEDLDDAPRAAAPPVVVDPMVAREGPKRPGRQLALPLAEGDYELPGLDLLHEGEVETPAVRTDKESLMQNAQLLVTVLEDFGIRGRISQVRPGPVVTLYEFEPAPGTKSSRVIGLADDIARSMSAASARIAVVPGRNAIGIELPNARREFVHLRALLASAREDQATGALVLALGKDIGGEPVYADLARMPHLLIAGTTGSGKSVGVNAMVLSLLYRLSPAECKFIMIDPKVLELSVYDGIPHLLAPVVTDPKKSVVALKWVVREMENRYRAMSKLGVRNITGYNLRLEHARKRGEALTRKVQTGFDTESGRPVYEEQPLDLTPLPYIVVIIDEMADLMLIAGKDVETAVQRLSQMARAAGVHLIMATQRPSVDVVTGTIKANFPTRISFQVTSKIDSRTILGEQGAEQLLGMGDMLYMVGGGKITRVHGPFVSDREVETVVAYLKSQGAPEYLEEITEDDFEGEDGALPTLAGEEDGASLYDQAVALVARERKASTSFIQRHLQIGYNRAATIVEQMEKAGVVSQANHVGKREVLVQDHSGRPYDD